MSVNLETQLVPVGTAFMLAIAVSGLIMNIIAICAIQSMKKQCKLFNNILIWLLLFDCWFLLSAPFFYFGVNYEHFDCKFCTRMIPYWSFPCAHMSLFGTILMTLAIAHERYVAVKDPMYYMRAGSQSPRTRLLLYVIPAIIVSVGFNVPRFLVFNLVQRNTANTTNPNDDATLATASAMTTTTPAVDYAIVVELTELGNNKSYLFYYTYLANTGLFGIIPFGLLIFFNSLTYASLRLQGNVRQQEPLDDAKITLGLGNHVLRQTTSQNVLERSAEERCVARVMIVIVIVFLGCHSMRVVLNIYDGNTGSRGNRGIDFYKVGVSDPYSTAVHTSVFLEMLNSSIGAVLYCYMSVSFRAQFVRTARRIFHYLPFGEHCQTSANSSASPSTAPAVTPPANSASPVMTAVGPFCSRVCATSQGTVSSPENHL